MVNKVWHYPDIIVNHSLASKCLSSLIELSDRDYPRRKYFSENIPALDIDYYESSLKKSMSGRTVDAVVGICSERQGIPVAERLLLVEMRMDYKSVKNLSVTEIVEKDKHSREVLLSCPDDVNIDPSLCLIFDNSIEPQSLSFLSRLKRGNKHELKNWQSYSPAKFCNHINAGIKMPYTPKEETKAIGERLVASARLGNLDNFDTECKYVRDYISEYSLRYEYNECRFLSERIKEALLIFDKCILDADDDSAYFDLLKEDMLKIVRRYVE